MHTKQMRCVGVISHWLRGADGCSSCQQPGVIRAWGGSGSLQAACSSRGVCAAFLTKTNHIFGSCDVADFSDLSTVRALGVLQLVDVALFENQEQFLFKFDDPSFLFLASFTTVL
jgi:hypothetical protein